RVDLYKKDGVTYVRVVDYKTYSKSLKMDYVREYGLDEQMLLYLFAYCKSSAADGEVFAPAGVLYDKAALPFVAETGNESPEELKEKQDAELKRTGIILEDTEIALAMDRKASGKYLPVTFDENGILKSGKGTLTESGFAELRDLLETQILSLAESVFDGDMDVRPLILDDHHDACHYCNMKPACRYCGSEKGDE
ncbi:MAG: PD-(D/E)XK nuclease family protein, partial [Clostridia bacterium]|nr:PD-(D/E)XK nuclease family protein [Clostridia bacterium]